MVEQVVAEVPFSMTLELFREDLDEVQTCDISCQLTPESKGFCLQCEEVAIDLRFEEFTVFALQSKAVASEQMIYAVC